jgi:hypothetical protein
LGKNVKVLMADKFAAVCFFACLKEEGSRNKGEARVPGLKKFKETEDEVWTVLTLPRNTTSISRSI